MSGRARVACETCGHVHTSTDAVAVGRFVGGGFYRANFDDAPYRATRAQAEADMCARRATQPKPQGADATPIASGRVNVVVSDDRADSRPFSAVQMERLARERAWQRFMSEAAFSLRLWSLDEDLASELPSPVQWLRDCAAELSALTHARAVLS